MDTYGPCVPRVYPPCYVIISPLSLCVVTGICGHWQLQEHGGVAAEEDCSHYGLSPPSLHHLPLPAPSKYDNTSWFVVIFFFLWPLIFSILPFCNTIVKPIGHHCTHCNPKYPLFALIIQSYYNHTYEGTYTYLPVNVLVICTSQEIEACLSLFSLLLYFPACSMTTLGLSSNYMSTCEI